MTSSPQMIVALLVMLLDMEKNKAAAVVLHLTTLHALVA
jgi:hypothetical protein